MNNCIIFFAEEKIPFFRRRFVLKWYSTGENGFYVLFVPYTLNQVTEMRKKRQEGLCTKISRKLCGRIKYIFIPDCPLIGKMLIKQGFLGVDGECVFCMLAQRIIKKVAKNEGLTDIEIGVYDIIFTDMCVGILENASEVCKNARIFTGNMDTACVYSNSIYEKTGMPICIANELSDVDILFALDRIEQTDSICVDVCGQNTHLKTRRIASLLFRFRGNLEELNELFGGTVDQRYIEFLLLSDICMKLGENIDFLGYSN